MSGVLVDTAACTNQHCRDLADEFITGLLQAAAGKPSGAKAESVAGDGLPKMSDDDGPIATVTANAKSRGSGYLTERDAVKIYALGTRLDNAPGSYPPDDTGSSGIAVAKAGVQLAYFTGYKHAFGFAHFCASLQLQPVIVGTTWHNGMFKPNKKGFIRPIGAVAGGHEYLAPGIDYSTQMLTFLNSWSDQWGMGGRFHMTFADFQTLLADQGDVTAPVGK
jgi:hypothetical protein